MLAIADPIGGHGPRRIPIAKPPPLDINASTPSRMRVGSTWSSLRGSVAPEASLPSPTPLSAPAEALDAAVSPVSSSAGPSSWSSLPGHLLELIFAQLRDPAGRWPSRKVLFAVCGACKLWRRVGHTLFFSNVWSNHTDVIVHPSQLFTLSPHPLRLHTSDHLLRCFVHRTPCPSSGLAPRLSRLWRFSMYLGSDHRGVRSGAGPGGGRGGGGGGQPQLLMSAQQASRRSYQLLLSTASGRGPGPGWSSQQQQQYYSHSGGGGAGPSPSSTGVVAVLRSNIRCSHYELLPETSCPWARRLVSVAGYMAPLAGGPPMPLICLEYRLRVRGIMLPRRMKVQVPVPHSLQRVVHNPLYDMHDMHGGGEMYGSGGMEVGAGVMEVGAGGNGGAPAMVGGGGGWPPPYGGAGGGGAGGGGAAAVMAPPLAAGGAAAAAAAVIGDGGEGLMDNLEDILEAAMRTEPLLFANMVDAAAVRPADDDDGGGGGAGPGAGGQGTGGGRGLSFRRARSGGAGGAGWGLGNILRRGFLNRRPTFGGGGEGGGVAAEGGHAGGSVQWWGPGTPGREGAGGDAAGGDGAAGGWTASLPPPVPAVRLQNKAPHWNDALMCWCLNFRGRVKMASVKNFQLMCSADGASRCVMQFGKVEEGIYILDFNPCVLTAAQAFAAALSTFETKYLL